MMSDGWFDAWGLGRLDGGIWECNTMGWGSKMVGCGRGAIGGRLKEWWWVSKSLVKVVAFDIDAEHEFELMLIADVDFVVEGFNVSFSSWICSIDM